MTQPSPVYHQHAALPGSGPTSRSPSTAAQSTPHAQCSPTAPSIAVQPPPPTGAASGANPLRAFLQSIGLKPLTELGFWKSRDEKPKVIVSDSRGMALARAGVHIFPITMTLSIFLLNKMNILNGPQFTGGGLFALQLVAKLHVSLKAFDKTCYKVLKGSHRS
jgi:hypothetical protein